MYNMDEKGFMIGVLQRSRRVFTRSSQQSKELAKAGQDGSRQWITIVAAICADDTSLPPAIIYPGELQSDWLEEFDPMQHKCVFAGSLKGWTNNELDLTD